MTKKLSGLRLAKPSATTLQVWADRLGLCLSVACLIHCLATPVLLIALPSLSYLVAEHDHDGHGHAMFHELMLMVLPLIAVLAFIPGYRQHRKLVIFYWAFPGIVALAVGVLLSHESPAIATMITILGSVLLVRAHFLNRKECACCATGHGHQTKSRRNQVFAKQNSTSTPMKPTARLTEIKSSNERLQSGEL